MSQSEVRRLRECGPRVHIGRQRLPLLAVSIPTILHAIRSERIIMKHLTAAAVCLLGCFFTCCAYAVDLEITARAATRALTEAAFKRDGKYDLVTPSKCTYTYLEWPEMAFANDQATIHLHLSARAGQEVAGQCLGGGEAFWLTVAGTPFVMGTIIGIKDLHITEITNPSYQVLLQAALQQGLAKALRHDVGASLQAALAKDVDHYRLKLNNLTITNLHARNNVLGATIEFGLAGDVLP